MRLKATIIGEMHNDLFYKCDVFDQLEGALVARLREAGGELPSMDDARLRALVHGVVETLPKKIPGEAFIKRGGNGNNSTELFATLGVPVKLVTVVGANAAWMIDEIAAAGVDTSAIVTVPSMTPVSTIIEDPATTRILVAPNLKQAMNFSSARLDPSMFKGSSLAFFTPLAPKFKPVLDLLHGPAGDAVLKAVTVEAQAISDMDTLRALAGAGVDLLFINKHDALLVTGAADLDTADEMLASIAAIRVVTMGDEGSMVASRFHPPVHVPVFNVDVVDRTGAGDAFAAGVLLKCHEFIEQHGSIISHLESASKDERKAFFTGLGTFGSAVAALKIRDARTPAKAEVDAFLSRGGGKPR